jgi:REP element-mobilizing transposase RayT
MIMSATSNHQDSRGRLSPHWRELSKRKAFYRRQLPHLQRDYRPHFITFCTHKKWVLPNCAKQIVLDCCAHDHDRTINLYVALVMPDHVHMIFTPLINQQAREIYSLASIMDAIKGASSHKINRALGRKGSVWQSESFDHVLRSSESLDAKVAYILANPLRAGLATKWEEYRWMWRRPAQIPKFLPDIVKSAMPSEAQSK